MKSKTRTNSLIESSYRFLVEDESTSDTSSSSGSVNRNRRRTRSESNIERENDQSDTTGYNEIQWSHNRDRLI